MRKKRTGGRFAWLSLLSGGLLFAGASYLAARKLSQRLISAEGLAPPPEGRKRLLASLERAATIVAEYVHPGSDRHPVDLSAVFASPGDVASRPTILFLHGKGGSAAEWEPDAVRALARGYNVLLTDLRGHGESGGDFVTYGLLEKEDIANALESARQRYSLDPERIGIHSCSAGSAVALEFAANRPAVRAIWLESPFAEPREMARHYLSVFTGVPSFLLGLTARWAVARAVARVQRELPAGSGRGFDEVSPLRAVARVRAPVLLVFGTRDRLVPPRFVERLAEALPPGSEVWKTTAGHCHHEDEAARMMAREYERRWSEFFARHLPVKESSESRVQS